MKHTPEIIERLKKARVDGYLTLLTENDPALPAWKELCNAWHIALIAASSGEGGGVIELNLETVITGLDPRSLERQLFNTPEPDLRWVGGALGDPAAAIDMARRLAMVFRTRLQDRSPGAGVESSEAAGFVVYDPHDESAILRHYQRCRAAGRTFVAVSDCVITVDVGVDFPLTTLRARSPEAALAWAERFWAGGGEV